MNISLVPLDIYKIPKNCNDVLVAQNFLYTVQHIVPETEGTDNLLIEPANKNFCHAIGVVSGSFSNLNICEEAVISLDCSLIPASILILCFFFYLGKEFDESSYVGYFQLNDERVVDIHRIVPTTSNENMAEGGGSNSSPVWSQSSRKKGKLTQHYKRNMKKLSDADDALLDDDKLLEFSFPRIELDKCMVVTNKNVYFVELR